METDDTLQVDVEQVLADRNPKLARLLPRFIKSYLKRVVHQEEINSILRRFSHQPPVAFIRSALSHMGITYQAVGLEHLPREGRYLFVANHPFGGMDGLMLCDELDRHFGSSRIIVNDLLMNIKPLAPLFVPINKHGRQNGDYAARFRATLAGEEQVATFPAGLCSRRIRGSVCDLPWKPSFIKSAVRYHRDVVPVYFEGRLSNFFYNLSAFRTACGIKANLEMLYLPDEMFAQCGHHFDIRFGEPIPWPQLATGGTPAQLARQIRERVYALKKCGTGGGCSRFV